MDARLLTQHMYRLSVHCTDFVTAATADHARELDNVKLLYTSYMYGQQIPRASYDAGITKPHCTTPTRTRVQVSTQYDKSTYIELRAPERAAAQPQPACPSPNHHGRLPQPSQPSRHDLPPRRCPNPARGSGANTRTAGSSTAPHSSSSHRPATRGRPANHGCKLVC